MGLIEEVHAAVDREVSAREAEIRKAFEGYIDPEAFAASKLSIPQAAQLLNWSSRTLRGYVSRGLIPLHPDSTDSKPLIRVSDILRLPGRGIKNTRANR